MLCLHRRKSRFLATVENNCWDFRMKMRLDFAHLGFQSIFDFVIPLMGVKCLVRLEITSGFIEYPCKLFFGICSNR